MQLGNCIKKNDPLLAALFRRVVSTLVVRSRPVGAKLARRLSWIEAAEIAGTSVRHMQRNHIAEFNQKFAVPAVEKRTAFRKCGRKDLDWIFSIQTERVVSKDTTVAIAARWWQIDKCRWRHSLAGQTVTIHQHLDDSVSIRFGPHVVGRYTTGRGKDGTVENQTQVSHRSLGIGSADSHFPTASTIRPLSPEPKAKRVA